MEDFIKDVKKLTNTDALTVEDQAQFFERIESLKEEGGLERFKKEISFFFENLVSIKFTYVIRFLQLKSLARIPIKSTKKNPKRR